MDVSDAYRAIREVRWFPGWTLTVEDGNHEGPFIRLVANVPNSYDPVTNITLDIHVDIGDILAIRDLTFDQFYDWLDHRLMRAIIHEHHEWFQIDGMPWVDPHAEGYTLESKGAA